MKPHLDSSSAFFVEKVWSWDLTFVFELLYFLWISFLERKRKRKGRGRGAEHFYRKCLSKDNIFFFLRGLSLVVEYITKGRWTVHLRCFHVAGGGKIYIYIYYILLFREFYNFSNVLCFNFFLWLFMFNKKTSFMQICKLSYIYGIKRVH